MDASNVYVVFVALLVTLYLARRTRKERKWAEVQRREVEAGMTEPPSLHPLLDPLRCIGCGCCVNACPEENVLGIVGGKAQLIGPAHCVGHGTCQEVCVMDGIQLVFGTERRGIDIPNVKPNYETNVPGIFIAGELGGMGLIRNAVSQGIKAMESIRDLDGLGQGDQLDVVIVGAGPTGFAASLYALEHNLRYVTLEQDSLGGTVAHYPRGKIVMTEPVVLPVVGKAKFRETTKEALLSFWQNIEKETGVAISYGEHVSRIETLSGKAIHVSTDRNNYRTRAVLLAIGRRGTPRKLGAPGEEKSKVVYRLIDPEQYRGAHVLVVGGGDSALEAAVSTADIPGATVTLSYRGDAFSRAKQKNRERVDQARKSGRLSVLLKSNVKEIGDDFVDIDHDGQRIKVPNSAVIISAGGILPTAFLEDIGITVETKHGTS